MQNINHAEDRTFHLDIRIPGMEDENCMKYCSSFSASFKTANNSIGTFSLTLVDPRITVMEYCLEEAFTNQLPISIEFGWYPGGMSRRYMCIPQSRSVNIRDSNYTEIQLELIQTEVYEVVDTPLLSKSYKDMSLELIIKDAILSDGFHIGTISKSAPSERGQLVSVERNNQTLMGFLNHIKSTYSTWDNKPYVIKIEAPDDNKEVKVVDKEVDTGASEKATVKVAEETESTEKKDKDIK